MVNKKIDEVKQFWDNRPCNIRHSKKKLGSIEYFEEVDRRRYFVEPHIIKFADFNKWRGKEVLEIGCGIGTDAIRFAKSGAKYTATELSKESLDITQQRFKEYGLKGKFYLGNAEELSSLIPEKKYDLIYSFGVIHHSPNPDAIISEIKNFMNNDTELRIMLYASNSWKNILIEAGLDQPEAQFGCPIAYTYTKDEIANLLNDFKIIKCQQDHIFPYVLEKYIQHEYEVQPWFKAMQPHMFQALKKVLGWHMLIRCKLKSNISTSLS